MGFQRILLIAVVLSFSSGVYAEIETSNENPSVNATENSSENSTADESPFKMNRAFPMQSPDDISDDGPGESARAVEEEVSIVLRGPASVRAIGKDARARVLTIQNSKRLTAVSTSPHWTVGEVLALESQTADVGIIAFVSVTTIQSNQDGTYEINCELLRQSRVHMVQTGDQVMQLDLSTANSNYKGTTDLIIKKAGNKDISSKYKPLFTQGLAVGETAQTLWEKEYLLTFYGHLQYGVRDWLTVGSVIPLNFFNAANVNAKIRLYDSVSTVVATGLTFANVPNEDRSTLNLNMYWDSISSESMISHTLVSISLLSFENSEGAAAIKSFGTSSLQTGNEFILSDWDRVLFGPSYNFKKETIGGYLSYVKIWDQFHVSVSVNTTDFAKLKIDQEKYEAYYFLFDAYWRF